MAEAAEKANSMAFIAKKLALGLAMALVLVLTGCEEDKRTLEEKASAPNPEFASRNVMHCPKCGSPTTAYSINGYKSFYKCSGPAPKFTPHSEKRWSRRLDVGNQPSER